MDPSGNRARPRISPGSMTRPRISTGTGLDHGSLQKHDSTMDHSRNRARPRIPPVTGLEQQIPPSKNKLSHTSKDTGIDPGSWQAKYTLG